MSTASKDSNRRAPETQQPRQQKTAQDQQDSSVVAIPQKRKKSAPKDAQKQSPLVDRLKKSGLDPHKLVDLALPGTSSKSKAKRRHRLIVFGFCLIVLLPSILFSGYMFFWASNQFHSTTSFAVRSSSQSAATDILGMVLDGSSDSTTSNSYIVSDYLQSQAVLEDLESSLNLEAIFNRPGADWLFRMGKGLSIEQQLAYWNSMVSISFDVTSGVMTVEVRTFRPEDSVNIAKAILYRSETLVNNLSESNRRQSVRYAEETVARAEARLKAIRKQMLAYRDETQEVSPEDNARIAMEMISNLDKEVVSKQAELKTLKTYLNDQSPRVRLLNQEISALKTQIESERRRLGDGPSRGANATGAGSKDRLALRISNYSDLKLEEEFANKFYTTALAGLESARQDADQKSMYLATFIKPTLSQEAQYPHRFLYSLGVFLTLFGLWGVAVLMYYNIRDRT